MNCTEWKPVLNDAVDDALTPEAWRALESHLRTCATCREELAALKILRLRSAALTKEHAPARDLWPAIRAELAEAAPRAKPRPGWWLPQLAAAAAVLAIALTIGEKARPAAAAGRAWTVSSLAGAPRVGAQAVQGQSEFRVGDWLETDGASRATVKIGAIGEVRVEPDSRVRLLGTAARDHRIELARGTMQALIWAPPRLFFVETPSATAIDLGCAYTLNVDDDGGSTLHVTAGYVALEDRRREAIVPAGMKCITRRGAGPGTPFAEDAPEPLRRALESFDFERGGAAALAEILATARADDAVTLWHLLARTSVSERGRVFDVLTKYETPPAGVTREGIVRGNASMRQAWATELGLNW